MGSGRESGAPASGGNSPATLILLKPSISREMNYLFQTHFLQLDMYVSVCSYMCVYIYVCGICAFV